MANSSSTPLRHLSREYYEGHVDRAYYVQQRRFLIVALVGGYGQEGSSHSATIPGLFPESGEFRPDSNDLVDALANRSDDISAHQIVESDLTAFFHLPTAPMDVFGPESISQQMAGINPGEKCTESSSVSGPISETAIRKAPSGSSLTGKLALALALALVLVLVLVLLLMVVWFVWQFL